MMNESPDVRIEISGHTDNTGSLNTNVRLSQERAKSVVDFLVARGIDLSRLEYRGYGPSQPVAPNDTEEGRSRNRRVEFKILGN
jgi:outer membrane protein OmpA-like peptidoglycan-associated protein